MVVVIKKKRRMGGGMGNGPPARLGWLGEGFGLGATTVTATAAASPAFQMTNDHNDSNSSNTRRDQSSATMAAIDLTGDNDDDDDANGNDSGNDYARLETPRVMNNDHDNGSNNNIIINNDDYYSTDKSSDYFADSILHSANIGSRTHDHQRGQKPREEVGSSSSSSSNAIVKNAKVGKFTSSKRNPTASSNVAAAGKQKSALFATTAGVATKTSSFAMSNPAAAATKRRSNEMWIDKYAPQTSTEVCMAPKKVDEIKSFLLSYITNNSEKRKQKRQRTNNTMSQKKQQQLCCYTKGDVVNYTNSNGEIYTCTILAVDIDDGMEPYYTIQLENNDNKHGNGGIREKQTDNAHLSPLLLDDAAGPSSSPPSILLQTKLLILAGSPGIGKSATIHALANEMSIEVLTWDDAHVEYSNNNNHNDGGGGGDYYIPYQSQLNSFEEFLSQSGVGVQSLEFVLDDDDDDDDNGISSSKRKATNNSKNKNKNYVGSLILIEEIPNLYNSEVEQTFRSIIEKYIHTSQIPTIYIYSDVNEGKVDPKELERLFPPQLLYDSNKLINVLQIQPVTKSKMKKCLQSIVKSEGLESSSRRGGRRQDSKVPASFYDEIHLSSGGDIRHAIFDMQFRFTSLTTTTTLSAGTTNTLLCDQISNIGNSCSSSSTKKDTKLSAFHALGKLLYAKRKVRQQSSLSLLSTGWDSEEDVTEYTSMLTTTTTTSHLATSTALKSWDDGRGPLEFIPEDILLQTDMGISSAITFLSYHSPDFFTDITELCTSHELLSDTALFIDRLYDGGGGDGGGPFPMDYAACIGSRAVAHANIHPAPSRFRQFTAPKVFSVLKKNRENENKIKQLRKRLSAVSSTGGGGDDSCNHDGGSKTSIRENIGSATQFVTNSLPYIRIVIPQDVNFALSNLHSYAKTSDESASVPVPSTVVEENRVLLEDDLVDEDDEWW